MRIWGQTIVPPAVTATLYFVIFGSLIGRRVGQVGGYDYMQFIAPGLIMMNVITNSYGNVVSSFFGAKFGKHLEELLVSPLPNWLIVAGYIMRRRAARRAGGLGGDASCRCSSRACASTHVLAVVSAVLLTSLVFALGGFINALFAKNFDQISWFPTFVLHAAHLSGRRVLFGHHAARLGAHRLARQSDPVHGERISLRLSRHLGRRSAPRLWHHDVAPPAAMFALAVTLLNRGTGIRE